jgi:hypothetical protein
MMGGSIGEWADGRMGGRRTIVRTAICVVALLSGHPPIRLSAQVGHDPGASPYHDIRHGAMVRVVGGYFGGTRGKIPVGPSYGPTGGLRLEYLAGNMLVFTTGIAYAQTDAYYVTAYDSTPKRVGPINNDIVLADVGLQLSLTGGKSFHGLQPYVGGTLGLAFGSTIAADTSGYQFGTKFTYGPEAGIRWYPARRLTFEFGGRMVFYKLQYPPAYKLYLLPLTAPLTEMTSHPWATVGVAWTF